MSRPIRILLAIVAAVAVTFAVVVAAFAFLLKPADYAPVLARAVAAATGRPFELRGALHLRFLPCCGVAVDGAALGNPPGFPAGPFAEVAGADLGLRLWPLLVRREVEVGRVTVRGLHVTLLERADGSRNWDFGPRAAGGEAAPSVSSAPAAFRLAGLDVRDGRVEYRSERSGDAWRVEALTARTGEVRPGADFDLELAGQWRDGRADRGADVKLASKGAVDADGRALVLRGPKLTVAAHGAALPARALNLVLGAKDLRVERSAATGAVAHGLEAEFEAKGMAGPAADASGQLVVHELAWTGGDAPALRVPELDATVGLAGPDIPGRTLDAHATLHDVALAGTDYLGTARGEVRVQGLGAQLAWQGTARRDAAGLGARGHVALDPVSPRSVLAVLGRAAPVTADPEALTRLAGGADLELGPDAVALERLDATLDRTHLAGRLRVARDAAHAVAFDLRLDALDLDRYRPPKTPDKKKDGAAPSAGAVDELPREGLRDRTVAGTLAAGQVIVGGTKVRNLAATLRLAGGVLRLDPLAAELYGGTVRGSLVYDASGRAPRLTLDHQLAGVHVGELLHDGWQTDKLQGTLAATLALRGEGATESALLRSLGGSAAAKLTDGVYRGVDFWYEVRRARALLKAQEGPPKPAAPATPITRLDFAGKIADGTWRSDTIAAEFPFVQLGGTGTMDLPARTLDMALTAKVTSTPTFEDGTTLNGVAGLALPLTVTGPMDGPKLRVDAAALAKGALGEKAKDVLKEKLRGFFNR